MKKLFIFRENSKQRDNSKQGILNIQNVSVNFKQAIAT